MSSAMSRRSAAGDPHLVHPALGGHRARARGRLSRFPPCRRRVRAVIRLHDRLHVGPLASFLRPEQPYIPHLTVVTVRDFGSPGIPRRSSIPATSPFPAHRGDRAAPARRRAGPPRRQGCARPARSVSLREETREGRSMRGIAAIRLSLVLAVMAAPHCPGLSARWADIPGRREQQTPAAPSARVQNSAPPQGLGPGSIWNMKVVGYTDNQGRPILLALVMPQGSRGDPPLGNLGDDIKNPLTGKVVGRTAPRSST